MYQIYASECKFAPNERAQTGFRVEGLSGIVTALHGILDCEQIAATSKVSGEIFQQLSITYVDIAHDVARLESLTDKATLAGGNGLQKPETAELAAGSKLSVIGHPDGSREQRITNTLELREPILVQLKTFLSGQNNSIVVDMLNRGSPNLENEVLDIDGVLTFGHSGAPVLDLATQEVVGVANGGLAGGATNFVWAIPWQHIRWTSYEEANDKLKVLQLDNPNLVFSLQERKEDPNSTISTSILSQFQDFETGDYIHITDGDNVGLYRLPSNESNILKSLTRGSIIKILSKPELISNSHWWEIQEVSDDNVVGWINSDSISSISIQILPILGPGDLVAVISSNRLRLRSSHSIESSIIVALSPNEVLSILEGPAEQDGYVWWKISNSDKKIGWAAAAGNSGIFLDLVDGESGSLLADSPATSIPIPSLSMSSSSTSIAIDTPKPDLTVIPQSTSIPTATEITTAFSKTPPLPATLTPLPRATLLLPAEGEFLSQRVTFTWESEYTLKQDEAWELVFWPEEGDAKKNGFNPAKGAGPHTEIQFDIDNAADSENLRNLLQTGQTYQWGVLLVHPKSTSSTYSRIRLASDSRTFTYGDGPSHETQEGSTETPGSTPIPKSTPAEPPPRPTSADP